ncbi:MAG: ferrous iron transport protein A [Ruminobacter sp.]|nr:ferrous iron transport protein A [Ruminobacter sp.]
MILNEMKEGQTGRIVRLLTEGARNRRLCEMGFLPGTVFIVTHRAPLGSPMAISVRGYEVIVGADDAVKVEVEIV